MSLLDLTGTPRASPTVDPARKFAITVISVTLLLVKTARALLPLLTIDSCSADPTQSLDAPWSATPELMISVKVATRSPQPLATLVAASLAASSASQPLSESKVDLQWLRSCELDID